ncbi:MAG: ribonuclease Z [Victivallales bacterium]|nr:ribonuclease Z [Victivallales bacterium]
MKITFLGTSHGGPLPGHYCTAILLESGKYKYLVDAAEPAASTLVNMGYKASQLTGVFITHAHSDHTSGLSFVCEQAQKYRFQFPDIALKVLLPEEQMIPALTGWIHANHGGFTDKEFSLHSYQKGIIYDDGNLRVKAIPTDHLIDTPNGQSYAFKITEIPTGKNVLFTGDLHPTFRDFPLADAQDCAIVCSELTHFKFDIALPTLKKLSTGLLAFYHLHTPWQSAEGQARALRECSELPYPVMLSYDGCSIEI